MGKVFGVFTCAADGEGLSQFDLAELYTTEDKAKAFVGNGQLIPFSSRNDVPLFYFTHGIYREGYLIEQITVQ